MSWVGVAIGSSVLGAGASIYGANKSADAIASGNDAAAAVQNRALDASIALQRPQLEVGNSALGQLASIFGLQQPSAIDFDSLGSGGGNRGVGAVNDLGAQGLSPIAGATWQGRPVFTDGNGGIYSPTGRDASINDGVTYLGQASEGNMRFKGPGGNTARFIKTQNGGVLDYRDGQFYTHRGPRADVIDVPDPVAPEQTPQGAQTAAPMDLNALVAENPLIKFNREQGEQAIARGAAARGLNQSGGTLKDLATFNQDLSGAGVQQFVLNPLFQLAGFGPQAAAGISGAAQSTGNNLANIAMSTADARGSAYQNAGNAIGSTFGGMSDLLMFKNILGVK